MKVVIIGSNGQLGSDLAEVFSENHTVVGLNHSDIEIGDIDNVKKILGEIKPDVVLNTAAQHNVPKCEENPELAFRVNGLGAWNLAKASNDLGYKLVHYSTDYVFDGKKMKPYTEEDACRPLNTYAITKLAGENFITAYSDSAIVLRVSGIYGKVPCRAKGGNFVTNMIKFASEKPEVKVVTDEILTPTPTRVIAQGTQSLLEVKEAAGIFHMTCEGEVSWYEFAKVIFDTLMLTTPLLPASVNDFPSVVKRPFYSVLENGRLQTLNVDKMPHWKDALITFLNQNYTV